MAADHIMESMARGWVVNGKEGETPGKALCRLASGHGLGTLFFASPDSVSGTSGK